MNQGNGMCENRLKAGSLRSLGLGPDESQRVGLVCPRARELDQVAAAAAQPELAQIGRGGQRPWVDLEAPPQIESERRALHAHHRKRLVVERTPLRGQWEVIPAGVHMRRRIADARPVTRRLPTELEALVDRAHAVVSRRYEMGVHIDDPGIGHHLQDA